MNPSIFNFNEHGVRIVYGANGSGKSGYIRLLKNVDFICDTKMFASEQSMVLNFG